MAFPGMEAPCPALVVEDGKVLCSIVKAEESAGMEPMIRRSLGIGCGCSMPDEDTTDVEVQRFEEASFIKIHGYAKEHKQ